jgi:glycosyltransferase involved in cell wall biosynthesis
MKKPASWSIAYFSPLPPTRSGIADYSYELLPYLARRVDVTLFVTNSRVPDSLRENFDIQPLEDYPALWHMYDVAIYQIGNSEYHEAIYSMALQYPGIVVLHEYFLHHLVVARTIGRGNFSGYIREMGYALGMQGVDWARQVRDGLRELPFFEITLNERVLDSSLGVIAHSEYIRRRIQACHHALPVAVIPQSIGRVSDSDMIEESGTPLLSRQDLGYPQDSLVFCTAGQVTKTKQVTLALEAFNDLKDEFPNALYAVIGEEPGRDVNLTDWLAQHSLQKRVIWTGYVPDGTHFTSWVAAADVLVNLRYPTVGETSRTALLGLATGRPVIVVDDGWYAELPDDVCVKVPPNDIDALASAMRELAGDEQLRRKIGRQAIEYARRYHDPEQVAEMYAGFVGDVVKGVVCRYAG